MINDYPRSGDRWRKYLALITVSLVLRYLGVVRGNSTAEAMSRLGDVVFAFVLLTFTLPLLLIVALVIRLESPGRVLERQACIGAGGRRFQMLKFQTEICSSGGATPEWGTTATKTGRFLRYTRIEYLPQLLNLLRGDLSVLDPKKRSPSFLH